MLGPGMGTPVQLIGDTECGSSRVGTVGTTYNEASWPVRPGTRGLIDCINQSQQNAIWSLVGSGSAAPS